MLKSSWFWFLVVWMLALLVATGFLAVRESTPWWGWGLVGVALLVGLATTWILRQRALIRALARGQDAQSRDTFEEAWKSGLRSDFRKLIAASATTVQIGVRAKTSLDRLRLVWVVAKNPSGADAVLAVAGGRDITTALAHELTGEFSRLASWIVQGDTVLLVLREYPDPRQAASTERAEFLLREIEAAGKLRSVDAALVLPGPSPDRQEAESLHPTLAFLAESSGVEFPLHVLLEAPDGVSRIAGLSGEMPGARVPWGKQDSVAKGFDEAWSRFEEGLAEKEPGFLALAHKQGVAPGDVLLEVQALRELKASARAKILAVSSQYATRTQPFLRGFYFGSRSGEPTEAGGLGDGFIGGVGSGAKSPNRRNILAILSEEAPIARLGSRRQVRSSVLATASLVASILVCSALVLAALHGAWTGGRLERDWTSRLAVIQSSAWDSPSEMAASLGHLDALDSLVEEIDDGRPWLLAPGFYPDGHLLPQARMELDRRLKALATGAFATQESRVRGLAQVATSQEIDVGDLYRELKTYLLVSADGWVQGESDEGSAGLAAALVDAWSGHMGLSDPLPARERRLLPKLAESVVERIEDDEKGWLGASDPALVASARFEVRNAKNQTGTFARLITAADSLPALTADSLGLRPSDLGCGDIEIRPSFTRNGWLKAIKPALDQLAAGKADWVLGPVTDSTSAQGTSAENLAELRRRYVEAYVAAWTAAFDSLPCGIPADNQRMASALQILSSPYDRGNPKGLIAFLSRFLEETNLSADPSKPLPNLPVGKGLAKAANTVGKVADAVASHLPPGERPVEVLVAEGLAARIEWAAMATKGGLDTYNKDLQQLATILGQQAGGQEAMAFAGGVLRQDPRNPLVHALGEASALRDKLPSGLHGWWDAHSRDILLGIARNLIPAATQVANKTFREQVWQPWQNLTRGNYPFDPYAETEASIEEIDRLINPQTGAIAVFLKSIENIVEVQGDDLVPRAGNGLAPGLDPASIQGLRRILRMGAYFYGKGGSAWKGVSATISVRADSRAKVVLATGPQSVEASYGAEKRITLRWPQKSQSGATLQAVTITSSFEERREGEWALLRLFESNGGGSNERTFSFNDRSYIVDVPVSVRLDQPGGPFLDRDFFKASLGPDLFR